LTHTPAVYANQLEVITTRLKKTNAKLIYGLTTPVPAGEPGRFMGDEHIYNYRARRVMGNAGVPINDLHSLVAPQMSRLQTRPGNVHFKPEGSRILGEQVAERIRAALR
jgi:lysophospholipase L1-like esterase